MAHSSSGTLADQVTAVYIAHENSQRQFATLLSRSGRRLYPGEIERRQELAQILQSYLNDPTTDEETEIEKIYRMLGGASILFTILFKDGKNHDRRPKILSGLHLTKQEKEWMIPQARLLLGFYRMVLWRNPRLILYISPNAHKFGPYPQSPKFMRVISMVSNLATSAAYPHLQDCLADLLVACYDPLVRSPEGWHRATGMLRLINRMVSDIILNFSALVTNSPPLQLIDNDNDNEDRDGENGGNPIDNGNFTVGESYMIPSEAAVAQLYPPIPVNQSIFCMDQVEITALLPLSRLFYLHISLLTHTHLPTSATSTPPLDLSHQVTNHVREWSEMFTTFIIDHTNSDGKLICPGGHENVLAGLDGNGNAIFAMIDEGLGTCRCVGEILARKGQQELSVASSIESARSTTSTSEAIYPLASRYALSLRAYICLLAFDDGPVPIATDPASTPRASIVISLQRQLLLLLLDFMNLALRDVSVYTIAKGCLLTPLKSLVGKFTDSLESGSELNHDKCDMKFVLNMLCKLLSTSNTHDGSYCIPYSDLDIRDSSIQEKYLSLCKAFPSRFTDSPIIELAEPISSNQPPMKRIRLLSISNLPENPASHSTSTTPTVTKLAAFPLEFQTPQYNLFVRLMEKVKITIVPLSNLENNITLASHLSFPNASTIETSLASLFDELDKGELSEVDVGKWIEQLGRIICLCCGTQSGSDIEAHTLCSSDQGNEIGVGKPRFEETHPECSVCDHSCVDTRLHDDKWRNRIKTEQVGGLVSLQLDHQLISTTISVIVSLIGLPQFAKTTIPRIALISVAGRVAKHIRQITRITRTAVDQMKKKPEFQGRPNKDAIMNVSLVSPPIHTCELISPSQCSKLVDLVRTSLLGQYVLKSLHSSVRELRISSVQALEGFVSQEMGRARATNREFVEEFLLMLENRTKSSRQLEGQSEEGVTMASVDILMGDSDREKRKDKASASLLEAVVGSWGVLARGFRTELESFAHKTEIQHSKGPGRTNDDESNPTSTEQNHQIESDDDDDMGLLQDVCNEDTTITAEQGLVSALVQLISFLGSDNPYIASVVSIEVQLTATFQLQPTSREVTDSTLAARLPTVIIDSYLRPYLSHIMPYITSKNKYSLPTIQRLAGLMGRSADDLLLQTQIDTVPRLVASGNVEVLQKIAEARSQMSGSPTTIRDVCLRPPRVLGAVLAEVLVQCTGEAMINSLQPVTEKEDSTKAPAHPQFSFGGISTAVIGRFAAVAPEFKSMSITLQELIKSEFNSAACELLKRVAPTGRSGRKSSVFVPSSTPQAALQSIALLAAIWADRKPSPLPSPRISRIIVDFFSDQLLGIVTPFSHILSSPSNTHSLTSKRQALRAIGEIVRLAGGRVGFAIPQIRSSVEAAISTGLVDGGMEVWLSVVQQAKSEVEDGNQVEIASLIDHTFSLVAEYWDRLSITSGQRVCDLLAYLSRSHPKVLQNRASLLAQLPATPLLSKFSTDLNKYAAGRDLPSQLTDFTSRCTNENGIVVQRGLIELVAWLEQSSNAIWIQGAVVAGPIAPIEILYRALLDAPFRFSGHRRQNIVSLCASALGLIGAVDSSRIEAMRGKKEIIMVSNFEDHTECIEFVASLLGTVLVVAFRSTSNARAQNYLAFTMQELMKWCGFGGAVSGKSTQANNVITQVWQSMPEGVRTTLAPYLNSRFFLQSPAPEPGGVKYPVFRPRMAYLTWLRTVTRDLMQRAKGINAEGIFNIIGRVIRWQDPSIAGFMLPYAVLHVVVTGSDTDRDDIVTEIMTVLEVGGEGKEGPDNVQDEEIRMYGGDVFRILDYLSRWRLERERDSHSKEKEKLRGKDKNRNAAGQPPGADNSVKLVSSVLASIPAELISTRAMQWGAYARALFHWEQFERERQEKLRKEKARSSDTEKISGKKVVGTGSVGSQDDYFLRLQQIYASITDPDCIEGISAHLHALSPEQRVLEDKEAGRWSAVQSWCEQEIVKRPADSGVRLELLGALREGGRYAMLLARAQAFLAAEYVGESGVGNGEKDGNNNRVLPFAVEAAWAMGEWKVLEGLVGKLDVRGNSYVSRANPSFDSSGRLDRVSNDGNHTSTISNSEDDSHFNVSIGRALLALRQSDRRYFFSTVQRLRENISQSFSFSGTVSVQTCNEQLLRLHIIKEIEMIGQTRFLKMEPQPNTAISVQVSSEMNGEHADLLRTLSSRSAIIPVSQQLPLLVLRMAAMTAANIHPSSIASVLLQAGRLARKSRMTDTAYEMVLRALDLDEELAVVEQAKGMWERSGISAHQGGGSGTGAGARRAMRILEGGIDRMILAKVTAGNQPESDRLTASSSTVGHGTNQPTSVTRLTGADYARARAVLLLAKWMDRAGSTRSDAVIIQYRRANEMYGRWEKGHYHLGRYYNKQLESEETLQPPQQSNAFHSGDHARLVISNYLKSVMFGAKHAFETIPRILTLWLDLATEVEKTVGSSGYASKKETLEKINDFILKYIHRTSPYMFYNALTQLLSRLGMADKDVIKTVNIILMRIVTFYPRQSLWSVLAVSKSTIAAKAMHAKTLLEIVKNRKRSRQSTSIAADSELELGRVVNQAIRLTDALVRACDAVIEPRITAASLSRHLFFDPSLAPSFLVVPIEAALTPTLPTGVGAELLKRHEPFSRSVVTIARFEDNVLVLNSLQRPRKITLRGSDGRPYSLLCKPKDDLRLDQRTMEFNGIINRALKQDPDSSRRRLSIKTNAVTPLNEECGAIEWLEGIKPLRDILLRLYTRKGLKFDFMAIKALLDDAASAADKNSLFSSKLIPMFPAILHEFFTESFPEPESWLAARLRYTRSMAVMSIVGHVIGLGDRHGENILLHEPSGMVVHVDFNCLFDKGLTFEKPELVPFRLTHNMVDACGPYGIEGPFRRSAEITTSLLRTHEEGLLTVLETFVHDPTAGFTGRKRKKVAGVPHTPAEVLESVRNKVRGLMRGEAVPLGVEGWVDALIGMAMEEGRLVAMYIGWCAFL